MSRINVTAAVFIIFVITFCSATAGYAEEQGSNIFISDGNLIQKSNSAADISKEIAAVKKQVSSQEVGNEENAVTKYDLGEKYRLGRGVTRDEAEAAKWYRKSADQGYAPAESALAHMYEFGFGGLTEDKVEAEKLYHQAADQGDVLAKFSLFLMKYPNTAVIAIVGIPAIWVLINALWLLVVTKVVLKFIPSFKTLLKAACVCSIFYPVYCVLGATKPELHILFIIILTMISCQILGKIIKHPKTGPIGRQKGGLIFIGSILGQMVLSLF